MRITRLILSLLLFINLLARAEDKIRISTFSTLLTEIAQQVGGNSVEVTGHVKPGIDPHDFEPKPSDLKIASNADLVLLSAKNMEGYLPKIKEMMGPRTTIVEVGDRIPSLKLTVDHGDHSHDGLDPHWWHSIRNIARATKIVRGELMKLRPDQKLIFSANSAMYLAKLEKLQSWVEEEVAKVPRDQRKLVTQHDAFGYFAKEYGFTVIAISGVSKSDQPGSKRVAEMIQQIKQTRVKAVFSEDIMNPKIIREITKETGAKFAGELLSDGLGTGSKGTIEGMFRHNVTTIVEALR